MYNNKRVYLSITTLFLAALAGCQAPDVRKDELFTKTVGIINSGGRNLILIIDGSGSMKQNDPAFYRIEASHLVASIAEEGDNLGIIRFSDSAEAIMALESIKDIKKDSLHQRIEEGLRKAGGETDYVRPLNAASAMLEANPTGATCVIFASDGEHNVVSKEKVYEALEAFIHNEWPIYTIAITKKAESDLLKNMATETKGAYLYASDATALFEQIQMLATAFWGYSVVKNHEEPTLVIGLRSAHFMGLRHQGGSSIGAIKCDRKPLSIENFNQYPSEYYEYSRIPNFDVWSLQNPKTGLYEMELINQGKAAGIIGKPSFEIDYTSDKTDPCSIYVSPAEVRICLRVTGSPEELEEIEKEAKATIEIISQTTGKKQLITLIPHFREDMLTYAGSTQIVVRQTETYQARPSLSIGSWEHSLLPRTFGIDYIEPPIVQVKSDLINFGTFLPWERSKKRPVEIELLNTETSFIEISEVDNKDIPVMMALSWEESGDKKLTLKRGKHKYLLQLIAREAKTGIHHSIFHVSADRGVILKPDPCKIPFDFGVISKLIKVQPETISFGAIKAGLLSNPISLEVSTESKEKLEFHIKTQNGQTVRSDSNIFEGLPRNSFVVSSAEPFQAKFNVHPKATWVGEKKLVLVITSTQGNEQQKVPVSFVVIPSITYSPSITNLDVVADTLGIKQTKLEITNNSNKEITLQLIKGVLKGEKTKKEILTDDIGLDKNSITLVAGGTESVIFRGRTHETLPDDTYSGVIRVIWEGHEVCTIPVIMGVKRGAIK